MKLRYDNPLWAFLGALLFLLIFSWSTTPIYLLYGSDSPFFEIIGLGITQGKIPYVDLWDHKGPIIFFIDALGFTFGMGKTGVFILQVLFMTVTLFFLYKLAALFTDSPKKAFFSVLLTLIPLVDFICEGNQCEEWMLPFTASSLWLSCRYVLSREEYHSPWMSLWYGLCFAIMFYIRPNDACMQIGGIFFGLFLLWIVRKQYRQLLPNIATFILGCIIVSIPVWWYFIAKDAVPDFIYGMIIHNIRYTGDAMFTLGGIGMILIPLIIEGTIIYLTRKGGNKELSYIFIPILVFTIAVIGKRDYYHYLIPTIPAVTVCFALCMQNKWKTFLWVLCVLFAIFSFRQCKTIVKGFTHWDRLKALYEQTDALYDNVPEAERNNIWCYNLWNYMGDGHSPHVESLVASYLHKGITPANPDFVWFQSDYKDNPLSVRDVCPRWIVLDPGCEFQKDFEWIFENYELVASTPSEPVCEIRLYRRREQ